jgi:hypothetical protein
MSHLTEEQLSALADGALEGRAREAAERHLETCLECREALAGLVSQDRALSSALDHDPGEAYFESFAARVGGRIRAAGLEGAQAREPEGRSLADWFRSPRKLTLVAAVATVVAGAGLVMLASREVRVPALREKEIESRAAQEVPPGPVSRLPGGQPLANAPAAPPVPQTVRREVARAGREAASPPQAAPTGEKSAVTNERAPMARAQQVRRNEVGEDVPVTRADGSVYQPSRDARPPAAPGEVARVHKPQYVEPLGSAGRADALRGGARPAPTEAGALVSGADRVALEADAKAVPAPAAGQAVTTQSEQVAPSPLGLTDRGQALRSQGVRDPFDELRNNPRVFAKNAQRLTALAQTMDVAPAWDSAAAEWEQVIVGVLGGPLESETRFQVARARFMAWRRSATERRATRAADALGAFLAQAPKGARRDTVQGWLGQLKP